MFIGVSRLIFIFLFHCRHDFENYREKRWCATEEKLEPRCLTREKEKIPCEGSTIGVFRESYASSAHYG